MSLLLTNLKSGLAFKIMVNNIKTMGLAQWLLFELCPSFYVNGVNRPDMEAEAFGWLKHIPWASMGTTVWLLICAWFGIPRWTTWALLVIIPFIVEVIQFIRADASYINPVNSFLDILFYVIGGAMTYYVIYLIQEGVL